MAATVAARNVCLEWAGRRRSSPSATRRPAAGRRSGIQAQVKLTLPGRQAFEQHAAALQRILARSQQDADAQPAAEADRGIPGR